MFSVGSRFLMSIGATIFFGSESPMLSSPSGSVPIIVACERGRSGPQSRCFKSGSDRSSCPDALPTDLSAADDLSFEEACPPSPFLSCPRCVEGGCTGFVVPAQSEVEFTGLVRLQNELAYPKDTGFFSPNPLLQQRLGLATASSLSRPSPDSTVPIPLLNLVFVSHRL